MEMVVLTIQTSYFKLWFDVSPPPPPPPPGAHYISTRNSLVMTHMGQFWNFKLGKKKRGLKTSEIGSIVIAGGRLQEGE